MKPFIFTLKLILLSVLVSAQVRTWTGAVNNAWSNPANWDQDLMPVGNNIALIPHPLSSGNYPVVSTNTSVVRDVVIEENATLTISGSSSLLSINSDLNNNGTVYIQNEGALSIGAVGFSGTLINDGEIYLESRGSLVQTATSSLAGSGTFYISKDGSNGQQYNFWSSPINSANTSVLGSTVYAFDPSQSTASNDDDNHDPGWVSAGSNMTVAKGFAARGSGSITFTGTVNNGNQSTTVSAFSNPDPEQGGVPFNLVGNPYPSAISANSFVTANSSVINGSLYFWDDPNNGGNYSSSDYATWSGSGSTAGGGGNTPNGNIGSCQGFMVHANNNGTVNFTNSMREANNSQFFKTADPANRVWVSLKNDQNHFNQILIAMLPGATDGKDWYYDAPKFRGSADISLFSYLDDKPMAIQGLSTMMEEEQKTIPLGVDAGHAGNYTFSIDSTGQMENFQIILEDKYKNIFHNLKAGDYQFSTAKAAYYDRFFVHLNQGTTGFDEVSGNTISIYQINDQLQVNFGGAAAGNGNIQLLSLNGQAMTDAIQIPEGQHSFRLSTNGLSPGIYLAKIETGGELITRKILITK